MHVLLSVLAAAPSGQGETGNPFAMFLPLILIFLIMWLLIFRPQAKKQKQHQRMLEEMQTGDHVVTAGGIYGTVKGLKKDNRVVILEIADNTKIEVVKSSISQNMSAEERNMAARKK